MPEKPIHQAVGTIADALKPAFGAIEEKCVEVGARLGAAIAILEKITADFAGLSTRLESAALNDATSALGRAASMVGEFAGTMKAERAIVEQLRGPIGTIGGNLSRIRGTVKTVGVLAINAKIAAAGLGSSGVDFSAFTHEVERMVGLAKASLARFEQDLAGLARHLRSALASQAEFDRRQAEAVRTIPKALADGVGAMAAHRQRANAAAGEVRARSRQVTGRVGEAVMALQIGDIARQRIEHVERALAVLGQLAGGDCEEEWWRGLSARRRQALLAEMCRLQSAQLAATASDLDREVRRIIAALTELAADAREILRLGNQTYGAGNRRQRTFLPELEENVRHAHGLLDDFAAVRSAADEVIGSVSDAVARLAGHIEPVRALEIDLRVMSLNMTLKCNHLGNGARALSAIALGLRACADGTTADAALVMDGLDGLSNEAGALRQRSRQASAVDGEIVERIMTSSVAELGEAGQGIADALATLERDSERAATMLEEAVNAIRFHIEIGTRLRGAADGLDDIAAGIDATMGSRGEDVTEIRDRMLALIGGHYTMASERAIHHRFARAAPATAEDGPDDGLF